jgi:hypothetical protein
MCFSAKNTPEKAMAIAIWRNAKTIKDN